MNARLCAPVFAIAVQLVAGCSAHDAPMASRLSPVVHGEDDRVEAEDASAPLAALAGTHAAIVVPIGRLTADGQQWRVEVATAQTRHDLCAGERFADQPALGRCSAFWIDDDLIVTAGHCMRTTADCARQVIIATWATRDGVPPSVIDDEDVYRCRRIAYVKTSGDNDHAVVQLDRARPVAALNPGRDLVVDTPLTVIGAPWGLPIKVDPAARAGRVDGTGFALAADTFAGSSGSLVVDDNLNWRGVLVGGAPDLVRDADCNRVHVLRDDALGERAIHASVVIDDLCDLDWPSERWCGRPPTCGDGVCSVDERCATDCDDTNARCGDGVCSASEEVTCEDCRFDAPDGFTCDPVFYDAGDGCDCECGVLDPDCDSDTTVIHGCDDDEVCIDGACVDDPNRVFDVPDDWTCNPGYYDANDGCDCACGAADPDCSDVDAELFGCNPGQICAAGECGFDDDGVPDAWFCNPTWYAAGDDCDCSCGAWDPDCDDETLGILGCEADQICGVDGICLNANVDAPTRRRGCSSAHLARSPLILLMALIAGRPRRRRPRHARHPLR